MLTYKDSHLSPSTGTSTISYIYTASVSTDKQTPLYSYHNHRYTHLHTKKAHWCVVIEQEFNSSVYLSFLLQHIQLKPLILPWGPERMKVACGEPSGLECWCLYAVLVGVVLKHRSQSIYCAVHQSDQWRQTSSSCTFCTCRMGLLKKFGEIAGEILAVLMLLSLNL